VLAALETAPELSASLRRQIQTKTSRLLPPSSMNQAKKIASAGEFVLDLLAACQPQTIAEVTATIRALAETRLEEALPIIAKFASDARPRVFGEILRCVAYFDEHDYGETVLAKSTRTYLDVDDEFTLTAARYMRSLKRLSLIYFSDEASLTTRYCLLPQVSSLKLFWWPEENLRMIGTRFRLANLDIFDMELSNLCSLDFVESVVELRIKDCSLSSFVGIERWRESLKKVSVVGHGSVDRSTLNDLRVAMPHLTVSP